MIERSHVIGPGEAAKEGDADFRHLTIGIA